MDTATASLAKILQSGEYVCVNTAVPLFDEHDEHDAKGNLVRRFDRAALEEIARRSNNRELATGDLSPFGPGHTIPDQYDANRILVRKIPETEQPPIWGYFRNYRVAPFGPQGKLAIQCEMWAKREYANEAKEYPRRSVELWLEDGFIDWVALLKRTPRRDLGLLTNSRNGQPRRYGFEDQERGSDGKWKRSGSDEKPSIRADDSTDEAEEASAKAEASGKNSDHQQAGYKHEDASSSHKTAAQTFGTREARLVQSKDKEAHKAQLEEFRRLQEHHGKRAKYHDDKAEEHAAKWQPKQHERDTIAKQTEDGKPVTVLRYAMEMYTMPDPTSTMPQASDLSPEEQAMCDRMMKYMASKGCFAMPGDMKPPAAPIGTPPAAPASPPPPAAAAGPPMPAVEPKREEMPLSVSAQLLRYERENAELKQRDAAKEQRLAALETENKLARYERDLTELHNQGFTFDIHEELQDCKEMTPEQFSRHKQRIVERYARDPAHIPDIPVLRGRVGQEGGPHSINERHQMLALQYMRQHENELETRGISRDQLWEESVEKTRGK